MYTFSYRFYPTAEETDKQFVRDTLTYLAALMGNGQILPGWSLASAQGCLISSCVVPLEDSLDHRFHNHYCIDDYNKLVEQSSRAPEYALVGPEVVLDKACRCTAPSSFILFTTAIHPEPPVLCGDCGHHVSLYKLPFYQDNKDHYAILTWAGEYKACDELWTSSFGERYGGGQMSNPKSGLTVEGLEICKDLSAKLGKPFYYYLRTRSDRLAKACPSCGSNWMTEQSLAERFDLVCEACGFVSISNR